MNLEKKKHVEGKVQNRGKINRIAKELDSIMSLILHFHKTDRIGSYLKINLDSTSPISSSETANSTTKT